MLTPEAQILVRFALWLTVSEIHFVHVKGHQKSEMHRMTPNWTWTLSSQTYSIYTKYLPLRPKVSSVLLYDHPFPRYKFAENRKCTEWPQTELEHLTGKSTLYTLNTYPEAQILVRFALWLAVFEIQGRQNGNAPNDPKLNLNTWQSKVPFIHEILTHEAQILVRFTLRPAVWKISAHFIIPHWLPC